MHMLIDEKQEKRLGSSQEVSKILYSEISGLFIEEKGVSRVVSDTDIIKFSTDKAQ